MAVVQPMAKRNGLTVAYALYACGCGCQIRYPDEGPRRCPHPIRVC